MYLALYVLEVIDSVDGSRAPVTCHTDPGSSSNVVGDLSGGNVILSLLLTFIESNLHVRLHDRGLADMLQWDVPPLGRQLHHRPSVHQAVAKLERKTFVQLAKSKLAPCGCTCVHEH